MWVLMAGCGVFGLTMSNVTILSAIIVRREFGAASFGPVFGFASSIIQVATALGPSFYGVLRELSGVVSTAAGDCSWARCSCRDRRLER